MLIIMIDKSKYVVLDVETNGLSSKRDDLLSISIFRPDNERLYNRFLPLELNDRVYTTNINGITKRDLRAKKTLTQDEFDNVCEEFELCDRTILTYGSIDERFIKNYLKRKGIVGFDKLHFYNFKHDIASSKFSEGNVTKDNLCILFGIDNVNAIHSGANDCLLEWQLFEKLNGTKLIITNNDVFQFNSSYIIPASFLDNYSNLKYCIKNIRKFECHEQEIFREKINIKDLQKFDNNIDGVAIEHLINTMLKATDKTNLEFLVQNKKKLKYLGKLPSIYHYIDFSFNDDGTLQAIDESDEDVISEINANTLRLKEKIEPVVNYIKANILKNEVFTQELVVNKEDNVLAECDLSDENSTIECKTYNADANEIKYQLYYQSNGRACYLLKMAWNENWTTVTFIITKVVFNFNIVDKNSLEYRMEEFKKKMIDTTIELIDYKNSDTHVILQCKICGHQWESTCLMAKRENICPVCHPHIIKAKPKIRTEIEKIKQKEENRQKILENYFKRVKDISHGQIRCINYIGSREKATFKCEKCGFEWKTRADHITRHFQCSNCKTIPK